MNKELGKLLLHSKTKAQLEAFLSEPSHAVMLSGPDGSGKYTLAHALAAALLDINIQKLDLYPYFSYVTTPQNKQEISIDTVRRLVSSLSLKTPGKRQLERAVFVQNAHNLSREAQNALLKALEDPGSSTVFILSVPSDGSVLATIASRLQHIKVLPVALEAALAYYAQDYSPAQIESSWQLSQGKSGLLNELLKQAGDHPLRLVVEEAKDFLRMNRYERLIKIDTYDQAQLSIFLEALSRILSALHKSALAQNQASRVDRLLASRKQIEQTQTALAQNASTRLASLNLLLSLKV